MGTETSVSESEDNHELSGTWELHPGLLVLSSDPQFHSPTRQAKPKTQAPTALHQLMHAMAPKMLSTAATTALLLLALVLSVSSAVAGAAVACDPEACSALAVNAQVCGSNGVTYSSQCELELAQCTSSELQIASQGACSSKCDSECDDTHEALICGSNGITYLNACHFDRAYCEDHTLTPLGYGTCATKSTSPHQALRLDASE